MGLRQGEGEEGGLGREERLECGRKCRLDAIRAACSVEDKRKISFSYYEIYEMK